MNEWIWFHVAVISLLIFDLGFLNRNAHEIKIKEALKWSAIWISLGLLFGIYIWLTRGSTLGIQYYTAYVIEESLSVDNLMVFAVIFETFAIAKKYQHRLLFWGILGAILMRAFMILAGSQLIQHFGFVLYFFGALLIFSGIKFLIKKDDEHFEPRKSKVYRLAQKFLPLTEAEHNGRFLIKNPHGKGRALTLYFVALLIVESTDVLFAVDSVPAVLAISRDPFVVYTSNIAAILGLRALFFVLQDMIKRFRLLQPALGVILIYVGMKMLIDQWIHIPAGWNLVIVLGILSGAILISWFSPRQTHRAKNN